MIVTENIVKNIMYIVKTFVKVKYTSKHQMSIFDRRK